ncbi:MAG: adenylosuccinate synthase [Candidatus Eremiobacteraeota bacterium]|nr:adenylosuccinate synthase [Candidatus Eremiobacteraeota bacterium]MBC5828191.1 adenylosuccinate synthase [Candidatus Eremiobacteraeota bacterium]
MPVTVVVGLQWGDEGKGRIVDYLSRGADAVARFGGGANAGHTVRVGEETYKLRIVPSGVVAGVSQCIIGPGAVVSPSGLLAELATLNRCGVDTSGVWLSDLAHLIMPYHVEMDRALEKDRAEGALGTTGNGIGPAYADRVARCGMRAGDLRDLASCQAILERRKVPLQQIGISLDLNSIAMQLAALADSLLPHVCDTIALLHQTLRGGGRILAEGAQGTMLDVGLGTYPYVTSSVTVAGGASAGLGFGPKHVEHVVGVVKAYSTRVGSGPLPTELAGTEGETLRTRGAEVGVVTGRPRRCGWLDLPALKYAAQINGATHLALTKLDVLDDLERIPVCTAYRTGSPASLPFAIEAGAQPQCESLPGWNGTIGSVRTWSELPHNARSYVAYLEQYIGLPVSYISVGPERSQIIVRGGAPLVPRVAASA